MRAQMLCPSLPRIIAGTNKALSGISYSRGLVVSRASLSQQENDRKEPQQRCGHKDTTSSSKFTWTDCSVWKQAAKNTTRCLVGCSLGDLGAMFFLQAKFPSAPVGLSVGISMVCGIATSMALETAALYKMNGMSLRHAFQTARTMSLISMLSMETSENVVGLYLTDGDMSNLSLVSMSISMTAGFLTPLPYNYRQLKKYGRGCH